MTGLELLKKALAEAAKEEGYQFINDDELIISAQDWAETKIDKSAKWVINLYLLDMNVTGSNILIKL